MQLSGVKNKRNFLEIHHDNFDINNNNVTRKYVNNNLSHSTDKLNSISVNCSQSTTPTRQFVENSSPSTVQLSNHVKKSVKMSVPSNKRQILEEEFRKEKYPCNEKLQKLCIRLNMKYDEVQNYFKKRRREEKETNNKFSNLVKLLNNYLEQNLTAILHLP